MMRLGQAVESAHIHPLCAYEAIHLGGALSFAGREELDFACWDRELREAAQKDVFPFDP
jgi:hypothetical protein